MCVVWCGVSLTVVSTSGRSHHWDSEQHGAAGGSEGQPQGDL